MVVVALLVAITATNNVLATTMGNNLGNVATKNIAVIIATAMATSGGVVSGDAINDFGYGTKFGTQPGKVVMMLKI